MKKFLKVLLLVFVTILGLLSILFTITIFQATQVNVNLGSVVVAAIFIAYSLAASYVGSILGLVTTFMAYSRKVVWFLAISYIIYGLFILNNLIAFLGGGPNALIFLGPIVLYFISSFRLFIKLKKGRA